MPAGVIAVEDVKHTPLLGLALQPFHLRSLLLTQLLPISVVGVRLILALLAETVSDVRLPGLLRSARHADPIQHLVVQLSARAGAEAAPTVAALSVELHVTVRVLLVGFFWVVSQLAGLPQSYLASVVGCSAPRMLR